MKNVLSRTLPGFSGDTGTPLPFTDVALSTSVHRLRDLSLLARHTLITVSSMRKRGRLEPLSKTMITVQSSSSRTAMNARWYRCIVHAQAEARKLTERTLSSTRGTNAVAVVTFQKDQDACAKSSLDVRKNRDVTLRNCYIAIKIPAPLAVSNVLSLALETPGSVSHPTESLNDLISPLAIRFILNKLLRYKYFCPCVFLIIVCRLLQIFRKL